MRGAVSANSEGKLVAKCFVQLVSSPVVRSENILAIIDTGFTDALAVPESCLKSGWEKGKKLPLVINSLKGPVTVERVEIEFLWDGIQTKAVALVTEKHALIGMELMQGRTLTIQVENAGIWSIT
jgi:predicted aspartyl protease